MSLLRFSCLSLYTWVAFKVQNILFEFLCAWSWFEGEIQSRRSSSISSIRISQLRTSELLGGRAKWINNLSLDLNFVVAEKKEIAYRNLDRMLSWAELCPERNWRAGKLASQNEGVKGLALHWASKNLYTTSRRQPQRNVSLTLATGLYSAIYNVPGTSSTNYQLESLSERRLKIAFSDFLR